MAEQVAVIGGGAAGFFYAINAAQKKPHFKISIFEKTEQLLEKVLISGGGRCNVTHACFDTEKLSSFYPRGQKELRSLFNRFQPSDTIEWFKQRGVAIKKEIDGRMFPITDNSETIAHCLLDEAKKNGVQIKTGVGLLKLEPTEGKWKLFFDNGDEKVFDRVMMATGSQLRVWKMLSELGLEIVEPVPSLFTFNIKHSMLNEMAGTSFKNAEVKVKDSKLKTEGPMLITHWGLSGPAVLKLSAWGARELAEKKYKFEIQINWVNKHIDEVRDLLISYKNENCKRKVILYPLFDLSRRFWEKIILEAAVKDLIWQEISKSNIEKLLMLLCKTEMSVFGKSTFKEEFVTAGGVSLKEIDFKTMQSKKFPGLYFAGEVLNIDGVTGGFNFQAAWSGAWVAASS